MNYEQTKETRNGYTMRILTDDYPDSPANWDNLGQIVYAEKSRYVLGTKAATQSELDEIGERIQSGEYIGLPVYAYVHGGATISTGAFSCPWDSGQSGFVYCTREKALAEWGNTPDYEANALRVLSGEVKTFDQYLRGDVYGYTITDAHGDIVDSCWGFYGIEFAKEEAQAALKYWATKQGELFEAA
jgi:hypothetical protein